VNNEVDLDAAIAALHENMDRHIAEYGVSILTVSGGAYPYSYTIGMTERGRHEMLVLGLTQEDAMYVLNTLSVLPDLQPGNTVTLVGGFEVKLVLVDDALANQYAIQAYRHYRDRLEKVKGVLQVLIPDDKGVFPDDPKCHRKFRGAQMLQKETWWSTSIH
jgi:hypothetical protein